MNSGCSSSPPCSENSRKWRASQHLSLMNEGSDGGGEDDDEEEEEGREDNGLNSNIHLYS